MKSWLSFFFFITTAAISPIFELAPQMRVITEILSAARKSSFLGNSSINNRKLNYTNYVHVCNY